MYTCTCTRRTTCTNHSDQSSKPGPKRKCRRHENTSNPRRNTLSATSGTFHVTLLPCADQISDTSPEEEMRVCTVAPRLLLCLAALRLFNRGHPVYETRCALAYITYARDVCICRSRTTELITSHFQDFDLSHRQVQTAQQRWQIPVELSKATSTRISRTR